MSKNRPERENAPAPSAAETAQQKKKTKGDKGPIPWHPFWRLLISLLVVAHVLAVAVAPWSLSTDPALPPGYIPQRDAQGRETLPGPDSTDWQQPILQRTLWETFTPYLNLLYLNHGYEFFAPDPNGSHLFRYRIFDSGGTQIAEGEFPNLQQQWPRLYYHRHMMLAAQVSFLGEPAARNYGRHLLKVHGGHTCRLQWVFHSLLTPKQVADGVPLDDPSTYHVLEDLQVTATASNSSGSERPVSIPGAGRP